MKLVKGKFPSLPIVILVAIFIVIGISRYFFFNIERDIHNSQMEELENSYRNMTWSLIEGTVKEASLASQASSKYISSSIVNDIKDEYEDLETLKQELDEGDYFNSKLPSLILDNIKGKYLYNIQNGSNDVFVIATRNGVVINTDISKNNLPYHLIEDEMNYQFNYALAENAFENILNHNDFNIIYYEPKQPENGKDDHKVITVASFNALKEVFEQEGINGLKNYTVLVPTYITDDGDIFGTPDIDINGPAKNHKLIVVQRFNIYDVLMHIHSKDLELNKQQYESMKAKFSDSMHVRTITYTSIMLLDLVGLLVLVFYIALLMRHNERKVNNA